MGTHAGFTWQEDALYQELAMEAVIQKDKRLETDVCNIRVHPSTSSVLPLRSPVQISKTCGTGCKAACSLEARRQTGVVRSVVRHSPAQILVEDSQLDQPDNISQKRGALNYDVKFLQRLQWRYRKVLVILVCLGKGEDEKESFGGQNEIDRLSEMLAREYRLSVAEICHKTLPISAEIPDRVHLSPFFPSSYFITGRELCDNAISSLGQDWYHNEISECPSLISDSEDELEHSDFETDNTRTQYTSKDSEGCLATASTLAACLLACNEKNVIESKKDQQHQSPTQSKDSSSDRTRESQDGHSSCSSSTSRTRKRNHRPCSGDQKSADSSGDDGRKRQRRVTHATDDGVQGPCRLLACPFYKYDRRRYSEFNHLEKEYRGCSSVYMTSIPRLKQHLYRVHAPPENYCSSCYKVFDSRSQLDSHIRRRPPCEIATPKFTEKITHQQSIQLKKKQYGKTTAQNWYSIFKILFPKAQLPESPYLEDSQQVGVRSYLSLYQELIQPRLMQELGLDEGGRQAVNSVLEQSTSQVLQHLAHERVPRATEGPNQDRPPQSGCTSHQTNRLRDSNYLDTGTHTSDSPNTSESSLPETWCLGPYEAASSLQHSTFDDVIPSEHLSTDSSWFVPPTQSYHDMFPELAESGLDISWDF